MSKEKLFECLKYTYSKNLQEVILNIKLAKNMNTYWTVHSTTTNLACVVTALFILERRGNFMTRALAWVSDADWPQLFLP